MAANQEISKQVVYATLGETYSIAVPKQLNFSIMAYPYQDISKQVVYAELNDTNIQVAKQVVYAILEERVTNLGRRTSSSSYTFQSSPT